MEQGSTFSKVGTAALVLMVAVTVLVGADVLAGHWLRNPIQASGVAAALRMAAIFVAVDAVWVIVKAVAAKLRPYRSRRDGTHRATYGRIARVVR